MKKIIIGTVLFMLTNLASAQEEITKSLGSFNKISVSPKINLVLLEGNSESIRVIYSHVPAKKIRIEVAGEKLKIYLDNARIVDQRKKVYNEEGDYVSISEYEDAAVTAYVTYRQLKSVEMRGEEELICENELKADKFKLKVYGKAEVSLAAVRADKFKASLYGENKIKIKSGEISHQVYRLYGENKIDASGLVSTTVSANIYGEGKLKVRVSDEVHLNAIGEPIVDVTGGGNVNKGFIIGKVEIDRSK